jgi:phosphoglycerol transferase MdoB-like AlkP superfamily enzyme
MTTAVFSFARGRILQAFYIQPAAALFCCLLIVSAILAFIMSVFGLSFRFVERFFAEVRLRYIILAVLIILAAGWAVTLARALANNY